MYKASTLKWAINQLNKKIEERPAGGIKTEIDGEMRVIEYTKMKEELELLYKAAKEERLKIVVFCKECKAYSGGPNAPRGCCFPKQYTSGRFAKDYCSLWEDKDGMVRKGLY
jgi:hypothetical protein